MLPYSTSSAAARDGSRKVCGLDATAAATAAAAAAAAAAVPGPLLPCCALQAQVAAWCCCSHFDQVSVLDCGGVVREGAEVTHNAARPDDSAAQQGKLQECWGPCTHVQGLPAVYGPREGAVHRQGELRPTDESCTKLWRQPAAAAALQGLVNVRCTSTRDTTRGVDIFASKWHGTAASLLHMGLFLFLIEEDQS